MAHVHSLGYVVVEASDLDAWQEFGSGLLGLQIAERTPNRLRLRMDARLWRLDIRRGDQDAVAAIGWEVPGPRDLEEFAKRLERAGHAVKEGDQALLRDRQVTGLIRFQDPDGNNVELFYGQRQSHEPFVSPTGARFLTGEAGLGHVMQIVGDYARHTKLYTEVLGFRVSDYMDDGEREAGTFLHANPRHHSMAYASIPGVGPKVGHIMLEVDDMDVIGRALDKVLAGEAELASTLGRHTNDEMTSFYVKSPSGFEIEYGYGGRTVDDATWVPVRWSTAHYWGHQRKRNHAEPSI
ncbi:VOC family protein [Streptomyces sp. NPDC005507]|uniref:VOC family protein n=1 Tax=unclassified Streptomyces TaxID=2593676 RepID=UPI00339FE5A5